MSERLRAVTIETASRLHFGLLGWGGGAPRRFGGVGLMAAAPGVEVEVEQAETWSAEGSLASRALATARTAAAVLEASGVVVGPLCVRVRRSPREHVGLGVGTQLCLATARGVFEVAGLSNPPPERLAEATGRGRRSGIGLHGFARGGLIVDGGRATDEGIPPLLSRLEFPADWSILVVIPGGSRGLSGGAESSAFATLPPLPRATTDRLCGLVLLELLPAAAERDLHAFVAALEAMQALVGRGFASAQGGIYASPRSESIVAAMRDLGLRGVGQSSWGPALYGFSLGDEAERQSIRDHVLAACDLSDEDVLWTSARNSGAGVATRST